jgi:hypothetical protein
MLIASACCARVDHQRATAQEAGRAPSLLLLLVTQRAPKHMKAGIERAQNLKDPTSTRNIDVRKISMHLLKVTYVIYRALAHAHKRQENS